MQFVYHLELLQQENNIYRAKAVEENVQITAIKQDNFELQSKIQYLEKQYASKVAESELLSNNLLTATARQEELLNNLIKMGSLGKPKKKKRGIAA
jgi:hypothetical protein